MSKHTNGAAEAPATLTEQAPTAQAAPAVKKLSPKNKLVRGIDPSLITTWVDFNQTPENNKIIAAAAKYRASQLPADRPVNPLTGKQPTIGVDDVLREILETAIANAWDAIKADADLYTPAAPAKAAKPLEDMSMDELEKAAAKLQKQYDAAKSAGDRARALLAAAAAAKE